MNEPKYTYLYTFERNLYSANVKILRLVGKTIASQNLLFLHKLR